MRRAIAKPHLRLAGVDDGAFGRSDRTAPLIAVAWSSPDLVEAVAVGSVTVDGADATDRVVELVRRMPPWSGVRAVLLDGAAVGGFNVLDLGAIGRRLGRPVIAVTRRLPDFARVRAALEKYFPRDAATRWRRLRRYPLFEVATGAEPIWAACHGCTPDEARALLRRATRRGYWPEPLRLAHLIGHAIGVARRRPTRAASGAPVGDRTLKPRTRVRSTGPVA